MRGLDWFVFCVADVQTGFGPFVAVYLTTQKWTQFDIGLVLSVAGLVALFAQVPGGMLVDAARSERRVAGIAITVIALSALTYAAWPIFPAILTAATFHAAASCVLGPAIAAISLGLVGHSGIGERLGRNARFASIGNGFAAAADGGVRLFFCRAVGFHRHRASARANAARAPHDRAAGDQPGAGAWRSDRARGTEPASIPQPAAATRHC